MSKILISLHNGSGDLVQTFPFVEHLLRQNHDISYETVSVNFDLIRYFFSDTIRCIEYTESPNPIDRFVHRQMKDSNYDYIVNLNNMYYLNEIAHHLYSDSHAKNLNRQVLISFLFANSYLMDLPKSLSPSLYFKIKKVPTNKILIFTYSKSAENRKLYEPYTNQLVEFYKNEPNVLVNPRFNNLYDLSENINNAKLVVTVDTAPLHISEILSTPWIGLLTNNSQNILTKYYQHGLNVISSNVQCAPCNYHGGGCKRNENYEFDCIGGFNVKSIIDEVEKFRCF